MTDDHYTRRELEYRFSVIEDSMRGNRELARGMGNLATKVEVLTSETAHLKEDIDELKQRVTARWLFLGPIIAAIITGAVALIVHFAT